MPGPLARPPARHRSLVGRLRRRVLTVPALVVGTAVVTATVPIWLPVLLLADAVRGQAGLRSTRRRTNLGLGWTPRSTRR